MCTPNCGRSTALMSCRYWSGPSGQAQPIISTVNLVRFGLTSSISRAAVLHRGVEKLAGEVLRIGAVPDLGVVRSGDVDAAARAYGVSQRQASAHLGEVLAPLLRVGVEHVDPDAHLGDDHVFSGKRLLDGAHPVHVVDGRLRAVGGAIAEAAMFPGEDGRVVRVEKDRPAQADGLAAQRLAPAARRPGQARFDA